jgi:hypothetical protein
VSDKIKIEMTRADALRLGLLTCRCGHPDNNHFDWKDRSCAHCNCERYDERPRVGKFVK